MMSVGEFCNREVVICRPDEPLLEAARRMRDHHVGCLVAVTPDNGQRTPLGVLTDRDIVIGPFASGLPDAAEHPLREAMSQPPVTARASEPLLDALKRMRAHGIRRLVVVDDRGALEGILTFDDLVDLLSEEMGDLAQLLSRELGRERGP